MANKPLGSCTPMPQRGFTDAQLFNYFFLSVAVDTIEFMIEMKMPPQACGGKLVPCGVGGVIGPHNL
jgi:hypothetical protein